MKPTPKQTFRDTVALQMLHGLLHADVLPAPDKLVDHAYELADAVIARMRANDVRP
jgi:hypothetical protein